jgi:hypothetical protein
VSKKKAAAAEAEADPNKIQLVVSVSEKDGVKGYGFAYAGVPVPMNLGKGKFFAVKDKAGLLEWGMIGNPGGTMKVEVLRDGTAIKTRNKSEIVPPFDKGFDAFEILVS